ncbi:MAG TPA: SUMF1/EgtB/PvdO family nonheme iron enzyme [Verrucomicrobiae bacterium]|nr:SUMF1/EgtB/PvdO family nonheme iron enzyme [Verrucomicrobiae bacterium]
MKACSWILTAIWPLAADPAFAAPSVSNVRASQRAGTKLVDIHYDVAAGTNRVTVLVQISTNGGSTYAFPASSFSGEVGAGVAVGIDRLVVWNAGADWDDKVSSAVRFRVTADDGGAQAGGMVRIPAGWFQMGNSFGPDEGSDWELPRHSVYVSAFYIQATEVTKAQWDEVRSWGLMHGYTDLAAGVGEASNYPVGEVSWYDAVKWCNARSEKDGLTPCYTVYGVVFRTNMDGYLSDCNWAADGYRLPTEAEWEKAARGGFPGRRFPGGNTISHENVNYYSWWYRGAPYYPYDVSSTSGGHPDFEGGATGTSPVGHFAANGYGLFDMEGNVREWCWDWLVSTYYSVSSSSDPRGPTTGSCRVLRGGSCSEDASNCRIAYRGSDVYQGFMSKDLGFRPVRR